MTTGIPGDNTISRLVARHIHAQGPKTLQQCIDMLVDRGYQPTPSRSAIGLMITRAQLHLTGDQLTLDAVLARHYSKEPEYRGEIAAAAQPIPFRPLSARYIPSCRANRYDADQRPEHAIYMSGTSTEVLIRGAA